MYGWVFTLGSRAVSWASKKQTCISHSTMESEFIALAAAGKEVEWLRNLLLNIKLWPQPLPAISLHCDSEATMSSMVLLLLYMCSQVKTWQIHLLRDSQEI